MTIVFKTKNCRDYPFNTHAVGGRIKKYNNGLLLTLGDFDQDFPSKDLNVDSQDLSNDFGKILYIQGEKSEIISLGHRNPQGLLVDNDNIFITEHGPQGGDEININILLNLNLNN